MEINVSNKTDNIRRMPQRFRDGDCPAEVADIFDDPRWCDRYTVFYKTIEFGSVGYRGMSSNPSHPQGIGLYATMEVHNFRAYRDQSRRQRIAFTQLPQAVQDCVINDCTTPTN